MREWNWRYMGVEWVAYRNVRAQNVIVATRVTNYNEPIVKTNLNMLLLRKTAVYFSITLNEKNENGCLGQTEK